MQAGCESKGGLIVALTERQERLAKEREEIAARVASFKATQEKFQREREEFFRRAWRTVGKVQPPSARS